MAMTAKVLAQGTVPGTKTTLYTVPAATKAYITSLTFTNTNAAAQTLIIYANPGGTSRILKRFANFGQYFSASGGKGLVLEAGDLIEAQTTTAGAVDYVITGIEET